MISRLTGILVEKAATASVIDVAGVGYHVAHSLHTFEALPSTGEKVSLLTHLHVREDTLQLYGFSGADERHLFELLLGVSGVGPRVALAVLSGLSPEALARAVAEGNLAVLTQVSGVGKKTAERIVIELRDRVPAAPVGGTEAAAATRRAAAQTGLPGALFEDAVAALTALGLTRAAALEAVARAAADGPPEGVEDLVRRALAVNAPGRGARARVGAGV